MTPIFELEGVSKSYETPEGKVPVLQGVTLALGRGETASLVGPSGCGKSTLLSLIAGLLRPDAGRIRVAGTDLADLDEEGRAALRARTVGIVMQSNNLIPFLTARENVVLALRLGGRRGNLVVAEEMLDRFGVAHRAGHLPRQLSGGEAQRVVLAIALANEPGLLLADEFVSQLDAETAGGVIDDVLGRDLAVLFVTHDPDLAPRAGRRLRLEGRRVRAA